ncbi:MAG TPA: hypothetical protein QF753_11235 [Victivallales bacterium]|nr:hypothetical protein [Victivallales bacterium]
MNTIYVPGDGASNIKLSVYDFNSLETLFEESISTPSGEVEGYKCNHIKDETNWFDKTIKELPESFKNSVAISPVARGSSGAMIGENNIILDTADGNNTIAYTHLYPDEVEKEFMLAAGSLDKYFKECGSVASFPGSNNLIKRLFFEKIVRPEIYEKTVAFATFPMLISGHFLGDDFLKAIKTAGNEHSYWMSHTGARNINSQPGMPSSMIDKIDRFWDLVPKKIFYPYKPIDNISKIIAKKLGLPEKTKILPGGHDTCFSHIPIISTFYKSQPEYNGMPILQLEAGTWTMGAELGGDSKILPKDGYKHGIVVQGTVDGEPTVTSMYGGGFDYRAVKDLAEAKGLNFNAPYDEKLFHKVLKNNLAFVLPNIHPNNYGTGPFPQVNGRIINENFFYSSGETANIITNLCITATASYHIELIASNPESPIIITAGGSKGIFFGKLLATYTGRSVYSGINKYGIALTETTSLGAAIIGKAACLNIHPYDVNISSLGIIYNKITSFTGQTKELILNYKNLFMKEIEKAKN